jgi:hypothetical protein
MLHPYVSSTKSLAIAMRTGEQSAIRDAVEKLPPNVTPTSSSVACMRSLGVECLSMLAARVLLMFTSFVPHLLLCVVAALHEPVHDLRGGRLVLEVVDGACLGVHAATYHALNQQLSRHLQ